MSVDGPSLMDRYSKAESLLQCIFDPKKIANSILFPTWVGASDVFWYERFSTKGREYRLVNAQEKTNVKAFDHGRLAEALRNATGEAVDPADLPITNVEFGLNPAVIKFQCYNKSWIYHCETSELEEIAATSESGLVSPNGKYAVFFKSYNLWLRDIDGGEERQLTFDGEEHYCYGAAGRAWGGPMADDKELQAVWSPDSKRILTVQRDTRYVDSLPVLHNLPKDGSMRPTVQYVKIAYPGDEHVEDYRILAIDIENGCVTPAAHEKVPTIRNSGGFFSDKLGWWNANSETAYYVHLDRYYKSAKLIEFNVESGKTNALFEETTDTQLQLSDNADESPELLPLPDSNEVIWYSNRSGWGHLYLYSTEDGTLKRKITSGDWVVRNIVRYDDQSREVYLQTSSRQKAVNPHFRDLIKVHIDTGEMTELATGDCSYFAAQEGSMTAMLAVPFGAAPARSNAISPSGNFAVVTRSRPDEAPESMVVDRLGAEIMQLETTDLTSLPDGWTWPEPVKVIADDGKTEVYGCVYRPSKFSEDESYPVVNQVFNTPELPWLPEGSFACDGMFGLSFLTAAALAELGFIVVQFAGRGTTGRSKAFLDHGYGCLENANSLADHVAGIKQLAQRYPYMDLERVGIISEQGGPGGVQGLLDFPEFYKVGVASIVHDSRMISATMWGDKFEGPGAQSENAFPEEKAKNLKGKLLLTHPMLDTTSPPASAFRIIEALEKANKNFDMLFLPCMRHEISNYVTRRSWDYLVMHLMGEVPPHEYPLKGFHWSS